MSKNLNKSISCKKKIVFWNSRTIPTESRLAQEVFLNVTTLQGPELYLKMSIGAAFVEQYLRKVGWSGSYPEMSTLQRPLLHLNISTLHMPMLHLDVSRQQEPLLTTLQGPELHLDLYAQVACVAPGLIYYKLNEHVLLLGVSTLQNIMHLDVSTRRRAWTTGTCAALGRVYRTPQGLEPAMDLSAPKGLCCI
jgi:hypothetical protein